jgi:hypothetical protein
MLGLLYLQGAGAALQKDEAQALPLFRKAIEAGNGEGMLGLGSMYEFGLGGLPQDKAQAAEWYQRLQRRGSRSGLIALTTCDTKPLKNIGPCGHGRRRFPRTGARESAFSLEAKANPLVEFRSCERGTAAEE